MRTLLVTGCIGSGKSEVCRMLEKISGFPVFDSDSAARELYRDAGFVRNLENSLGTGLTDENGFFDKAKLSALIFTDSAARKTVETAVHPEVFRRFGRWKGAQTSGWVIFESAIALDIVLPQGFADKVLLVDAPEDVRIKRVLERNPQLDRRQIEARIASQQSHRNDPLVNFTIDNDGSRESLEKKVAEFVSKL